jgi:hypothetical protein
MVIHTSRGKIGAGELSFQRLPYLRYYRLPNSARALNGCMLGIETRWSEARQTFNQSHQLNDGQPIRN